MGPRMPRLARLPVSAASVFALFVSLVGSDVQAEAGLRTVVQDATLVALEGEDPSVLKPHMSIVIEGGLITQIAPANEIELREGDVAVWAKEGFVLAGLLEAIPGRMPSYAELARRPLRSVTTVATQCDEASLEWLRRVAANSPFALPSVARAPAGLAVRSLEPETSIDTRSKRAAWIRERTAGIALDAGLTDRGVLKVGARGDLLLLRNDPLSDLAACFRPEQVVIGGKPVRIAEIDANRDLIGRADLARTRWPAPSEGTRSFDIEAGGLLVGRLDVARDGQSGVERWAPPVDQRNTWSSHGPADAWTLQMEQVSGRGEGFRSTVTRQAKATAVKVEPVPENPKTPPSETTLDAAVDLVLLDPICLLLQYRSAVAALGVGERLQVETLELVPGPNSVQAGISTLRIERVAPIDSPLPIQQGSRALRLVATGGSVIGWVEVDAGGEPLRAALSAPEGITEYRSTPLQPSVEKKP